MLRPSDAGDNSESNGIKSRFGQKLELHVPQSWTTATCIVISCLNRSFFTFISLSATKTETRYRRAKAEAHWHLGPYPQGIIDETTDQWQTWLHACVKAKGRHFEHVLWSSPTIGSESFQTHQKSVFSSEPITLLKGRQHNFSVFV